MSGRILAGLIASAILVAGCGTEEIVTRAVATPHTAPTPSISSEPSAPEPNPSQRPARPIRLPEIPAQGFVVRGDHNLLLVGLEGEVLTTLPGLAVAGHSSDRSGVWLRKGPHFFRLEPGATRMKPLGRGSWRADTHVESDPPDLLPPQGARVQGVISGHWRYALRSPVSDVLLAQWSDECEVPSAHFVYPGSDPVHVSGPGRLWKLPSSEALGWTPDGVALVYLPKGACGGGGDPPGIYAFSEPGVSELIFETKGYPTVTMWGAAS